MASLIPLIPAAVQAGTALYGAYRQRKAEKRAERRGPREERISQFTPDQQRYFDLINSIITGEGEQPTGGLLGEVFGEEGFKKAYAEPAMRMFREEIAPQLAEQFSGAFGIPRASGAQSSSAFQNALARAGSDLSERLAEMRSRQRMQGLSALSNQFLQPREHITARGRGREDVLGQGLAELGIGGGEAFFNLLQDWLQEKYGSQPTVGASKQQGSYIDKFGNITGPMYG